MTKRDFRRVLESFCFRMSNAQAQELMSRIDPHNKGYISYLDFLDKFEPRETDVSAAVGWRFSRRARHREWIHVLTNECALLRTQTRYHERMRTLRNEHALSRTLHHFEQQEWTEACVATECRLLVAPG